MPEKKEVVVKNGNTTRWIGIAITLVVIIGGIIATWAVGNYIIGTVKVTAESNEDRIEVVEKDQSNFKTAVGKDISYIQKDIAKIHRGIQKQITVDDITKAIKAAK